MALTAGQTIALALEAAHSPGNAVQAQLLYNSILTELCHTYDFAEARGQYLFQFQPTSAPPIAKEGVPEDAMSWGLGQFGSLWGQFVWGEGRWGPIPPAGDGPGALSQPFWPGNQFGSGPYLLPVDYLRLSGSSGSSGGQRSFIWWLQGHLPPRSAASRCKQYRNNAYYPQCRSEHRSSSLSVAAWRICTAHVAGSGRRRRRGGSGACSCRAG